MKKNGLMDGWEVINHVKLEAGEDGFLTEECIKKMNMLQYGTENPTIEQIFGEDEEDEDNIFEPCVYVCNETYADTVNDLFR